MALGRTFVCTGCAREIAAWDEGDPYYVAEDGTRRYVYHPNPDRDHATGVESPALCLRCGADATLDSAAPRGPCPACGRRKVVETWHLEGRTCPSCRRGVFREDARGMMIS